MSKIGGYWCQAIVRAPAYDWEWPLGGFQAPSPRLAIRWLEKQAHRIANALDPIAGSIFPAAALAPVNPTAPNPGAILRAWARDMRAQGRHMEMLVNGDPITITAGQPDYIANNAYTDVVYSLSARPLTVDFATDWRFRGDIFAAA